jgi:hypothetical protein
MNLHGHTITAHNLSAAIHHIFWALTPMIRDFQPPGGEGKWWCE